MTHDVAARGTAAGPAPEPDRARSGRHANTTLVVLFLSLGGLSFAILQSLVAPALPAIATDLHASTASVSWVLTAYLLAASVLTPILGRLGDMLGKRRVLLVVLLVLAAGTVLSALAHSLALLIVGRALQGAAGAILPLSIGIVRDELPREKVGVTVGLLSALFGLGAGLGIVVAGPIVDHLSWQWLFWLPLVLIAAALLGVFFGVPESPIRAPGRLDLVGAGILSVSLVALLLVVDKGREWGWSDGKSIGLLAVGVLTLVAFVLVELRVREPLIDMRLMALRGVWTTNLVGLTFGFVMYGTFLLIPTLLELPSATGYGFGRSVSEAGLYLLPATLGMLVFGPLSGLLERRYGPKLPLVLGAVAVTAAFALPAVGHGQVWQLLASSALSGAGIGLAFAAMSNAIVEAVPATHTGEATSVNSIVRTIGGSVGTAVVAAVIISDSTPQGLPLDSAFTGGFWVCAVVAALSILAALALPAARRRRAQAVAAGVDDLAVPAPAAHGG
jgi:EmrB/QacA subfamily drug resistance transporter